MKASATLLFFLLFLQTLTNAQPLRPILVLNNEMHLSKISSLSITANKEIALTTSYDKTAKAWSIKEKSLIKTFRLPIGKNDEGTLFAGAISPDGKTIALSGWTGSWERSDCIYLLDFNSGSIVTTIRDLDNTVTQLSFSENGSYLAARTTTNLVQIFELSEKNNPLPLARIEESSQIVFSENELWALRENNLEQYSSKSKFQSVVNTIPFQQKMEAVAVGKKVIVGVDMNQRIHSVDLGNREYKIRTIQSFSSLTKAKIIQLNTQETEVLLAGNYQTKEPLEKKYSILKFSLSNGLEETIPALGNTFINILNLDRSTVLASSTYPDLGIVNTESNKTVWLKSSPSLILPSNGIVGLQLNKHGTKIAIISQNEGTIRFDFKQKLLFENASSDEWIGPLQLTDVTNWRGSRTATISGKLSTICEQREERILSYSSNLDQSALFWGTDWNLVKSDRNGSIIWRTPVTEQIVSVVYQPLNNLVVCLMGDGLVRWFDAVSGALKMSFYLEPTTNRWICFTEDGYYDASAGGDNLIGWHLNRSANETPLFYPASRFKQEYFNPFKIEQILGIENTQMILAAKATRELNREEVPPSIVISSQNIIEKSGPRGEIEIEYLIVQPKGATIKNYIIQVDGVPMQPNSYQIIDNSKLVLTSPPPRCTITMYAENNYGISEGKNVFLKLNKTNDAIGPKPNLYILAIGISEYQDPKNELKFAAMDAASFAQLFDNQKESMYGTISKKILTNEKATRSAIQDGFDWIISNTGHNDIAMIFFAGHGINDQRNIYYMAPYEANANSLRSSCLNFEELRQTISLIAGKSIVFIDACHSGNVMGSRELVNMNAIINDLNNIGSGNVTFTSSTGKELSYENIEWKHGAFTKAIIEAFEGLGFNSEGQLTIVGLETYISSRVKQLTDGKQHPTRQNSPNIPDFTIAVKK